MAGTVGKHSAAVIAALESLQSLWERTTDDSERARIKDTISKAMKELPSEQLAAYVEYQKERFRQAEQNLEAALKTLGNLQNGLEERRR